MKRPNIPVALEGYPFIGLAALATVVCGLLGFRCMATLSFAATAFILYFFRDPERVIPTAADAIVSPADGRVIRVEKEFDDRFLKAQAVKVSIFMNVFNVHVNRLPASGTVTGIQYYPGRFYSADTARGGLENEKCALILDAGDEKKMAVVQIAGLIARRIVCWAEPGDTLQRGERFGLIRFGSRVDLYLPPQTQIEVREGQAVRAGETVLGYFS